MARRAPVALVARAPAAAPEPVDRHHVVGVQAEPDDAVQPRAVERGDDEPQRLDQVRREVDVDLALQQRLADEPEIEVLQVAQAAVDELATSATRCRWRSRRARPARREYPRVAASSATPAPVIPPPITRTSNGSRVSVATASARGSTCPRGYRDGRDVRLGSCRRCGAFPVLGMAGEQLRSTQIDARGVAGDRQHYARGPEGRLGRQDLPALGALDGGVPVQPRRRDRSRQGRRRSRC